MNLKKCKIISIFGIFLISFFSHFCYEWFPCTITAIFFPVNESIFEHMKIILTSTLLYSIIEIILLKGFKIEYHNYLLSLFVMGFGGIVFYLLIFVPIYLLIGENMIISIGLLFITYLLGQIVCYFILNYKQIKYLDIISIIGIVVMFILFGYFTYNPLFNFLFQDPTNNQYGINTYEI